MTFGEEQKQRLLLAFSDLLYLVEQFGLVRAQEVLEDHPDIRKGFRALVGWDDVIPLGLPK